MGYKSIFTEERKDICGRTTRTTYGLKRIIFGTKERNNKNARTSFKRNNHLASEEKKKGYCDVKDIKSRKAEEVFFFLTVCKSRL